MNVYDTANRLAQEIKQSEEYATYKIAKEASEQSHRTTIPKVNDVISLKELVTNKKEIKDFDKGFDSINTTLADMPKVASGENEYPYILDMYAKKYNVDRIHLREFVKRFDYIALKFMNSKSIRDVINLSDDNFVKFLNTPFFMNGYLFLTLITF